jgi:hypothetical protein
MHAPRKRHWIERMLRSQYFLYALLLHVLVFLLLSGQVIFKGFIGGTQDFDSGDFIAGGDDGPLPPPPASEVQQPTETPEIQVPTTTSPTDIIAVDTQSPDTFNVNVSSIISPTLSTETKKDEVAMAQKPSVDAFNERMTAVRDYSDKWGTGGKGGVKGKGSSVQAEFVMYVAKYAGGDWNRNIVLRNQKVVGGSMPNLMKFINERSKGRIKASTIGEPLSLSSQEIFEKNPPFVYMTGAKDFKLTDQEVDNLRRYLLKGGAIWGDNSLAGGGSRFDVAFRREMKRVVPDADKPFKILPESHAIYTDAFVQLKGPPVGMNFVQQPLEAIEIDGFVAILYTPNNYGDMMRLTFKLGTKEPDLRTGPNKDSVTQEMIEMYGQRETYFRGFTADNAEAANQLGLNIVVHLLTRFQERLQLTL